ncbi:hypothetical protein [Nostoc sp. PCC 7107]|nr:hypothetical protein [Nostoc sp. PCC 7107]
MICKVWQNAWLVLSSSDIVRNSLYGDRTAAILIDEILSDRKVNSQ